MTRKPIIAGNWKMNTTWASAVNLAQKVCDNIYKSYEDIEVVMCPPFTSIKGVSNVIEYDKSRAKVGAQNVHEILPEGNAACTGEISVEMLKDLNCSYCIVGHSERRADNGETDQLVNAKIKLLLQNNIVPIVCCGESLQTNEQGKSIEFVQEQIQNALCGISKDDAEKIVIAYEPIWAIGTGRVPIPEEADKVCYAIRQVVSNNFDENTAASIRVLYGGSMKPENAQVFLTMPNIDGGLIGGAALDAMKFVDIIKTCSKVKKEIKSA